MLYLNAFSPHLTPTVRSYVKQNRITLSVIPGGCTGYIQPLDVSLNKPLKALIKEEHDDHFDQHMDEWQAGKFSVGDRRVLLTYWVAKAWKRLYLEYKDTIINTFRNVGLSLNPNGSEDQELTINDLPNIIVGDYHRDIEQQEESEETAAAAEAVAAVEEVEEEAEEERNWEQLQEGDVSEDERFQGIHSPTFVTDFLRPRKQHYPARDRYFLSQEAEAGDPLCLEDADGATTETEDNLGDNWDSDETEDDEFDPDEEAEDIEMVQKDHYMSS